MLARISDMYCTLPAGLLTSQGELTVDVEEDETIGNNNILKVFPNPASNWIKIELCGSDPIPYFILEIYNMQGEVLHRAVVADQQQYELNLLSWKLGIYLIRVYDGNRTETARIIKN